MDLRAHLIEHHGFNASTIDRHSDDWLDGYHERLHEDATAVHLDH